MLNNWTIFLFLGLVFLLVFIIIFFVRMNNRNNEYYNLINGTLLSVVPVKIDLKNDNIILYDRLEVLNNKKHISLFVFKSMINRKAKFELESLFQNLTINNFPFVKNTYALPFQLQDKIIVYDLYLNYYDERNQILYGQMQSNIRYNRLAISENITINTSNLSVFSKSDFVHSILTFFATKKTNKESVKLFYEYMILIKIKNTNYLENILTVNNIESIEILITYYAKLILGNQNTLVCKYYEGQFLVYTKSLKLNAKTFQKKINNYIKNNLINRNSYLQIETELIIAYSSLSSKSNVFALYNQVIDLNNSDVVKKNDLLEVRLKSSDISNAPSINHYELLYSPKIKDILTLKTAQIYSAKTKTSKYYYAQFQLLKNDYYTDLNNLMHNIQDAGLWWKIYEPLLIKTLDDVAKKKDHKDLIIPFLLRELENKTILTQIINIFNKRKNSLFKNRDLIICFENNDNFVINEWTKYENIIETLRHYQIKIAFTHELKNIDKFKLINHFKPDLVLLERNLLEDISFNFNKYVDVILALNYLKIIGTSNLIACGVSNAQEIILLKSLNLNFLTGSFFENEINKKQMNVLGYTSYWEWRKNS